MSGVGSVVLFILLAFWGDEWAFLRDNKKIFVWLAVACLFLTGFLVWYRDRPDLLIEERGVFLDTGGVNLEASTASPNFVTVMLYMVSTRHLPVAIKSFELTVRSYGRRLVGRIVSASGVTYYGARQTDLDRTKNTLLPQGLPQEGWVRFYFGGDHKLKGQPFVLTVTDTYNISYQLKGTVPLDFSEEIRMYIPPEAFKT